MFPYAMLKAGLRAVALPCMLAAPALSSAASSYSLTLVADGANTVELRDINNRGDVVGAAWMSDPGADRAFLRLADATTTWFDAPALKRARRVNDQGVVAGLGGDLASNRTTAATYDAAGGVFGTLPPLLQGRYSWLNAVSESGRAVGASQAVHKPEWDVYEYHAVAYDNGVATDLGTLGGNSYAEDVNRSGVVVGQSELPGGWFSHAFIHDGAAMVDMGTLGGSGSAAYAINDAGAAVGFSNTLNNATSHAFLYVNGVMTDLGSPDGGVSIAYDINQAGQVVGYSGAGGFVYAGGEMTLLDQLISPAAGWHIRDARGINDLGQIAGTACNAAGACVGAILTPVPEPATWGMLLGGLGVAGVYARRRAPRKFVA
ncbi:PEPxxWA-CTERM sorting domain-containing protein [Pseudoduganella namucuonensis]|uniref:VPLPA-CTERM protein sorting domain-containing protein n=1 Tax=Pseudoduganella namucuonensis TaxID=1035707 RepID=A0A1I7LF74_9BURK|nr:PEPxxWA-CTERM sorting domain-containing protein [Pseudoduganella namucuonensis]SFV08246.1 VPLPA-CTERM protein sorting domain-containing protein [Pseudoduganella namucuonensis]